VYSIEKCWDGTETEHNYKLKLSIVSGDLAFFVDAPFFNDAAPPEEDGDPYAVLARSAGEEVGKRHIQLAQYECVSIFIATGAVEDVPLENQEYIEILLGPHGHYLISGFNGQGDESGDQHMLFEVQPVVTINQEAKRWQVKASVPFFFLPAPGNDPNDALCLKWRFNFCAAHDLPGTVEGREYLSHATLLGNVPNFHQLVSFVPLLLSDASSQRLREISRASVSAKSVHESMLISQQMMTGTASEFTPTRLIRDLGNEKMEGVGEVLQRYQKLHEDNTKALVQKMMSEAEFVALCAQQMQPGEQVVICGKYWKRKGWSHRRCILILTSLPKLIYVDAKAPFTYRGKIDWKMTRPITPYKTSNERFDIELADSSRTYHFYDEENFGVNKWMGVISDINASWKAYLRDSLGEYDADVLDAMRRTKVRIANAKNASSCILL